MTPKERYDSGEKISFSQTKQDELTFGLGLLLPSGHFEEELSYQDLNDSDKAKVDKWYEIRGKTRE